jgi:hypothetical protein
MVLQQDDLSVGELLFPRLVHWRIAAKNNSAMPSVKTDSATTALGDSKGAQNATIAPASAIL